MQNSVYGGPTSPSLSFGGSGAGGVGGLAGFDGYPRWVFGAGIISDGFTGL